MSIKPFHQRMAELWTIQTRRELNGDEQQEMRLCMTANAKYCWEMSRLENLSVLAAMTRDDAWQHEIGRDIERLEGTAGGRG